MDEIIYDPNCFNNGDLLTISLRTLSKTLSSSLSVNSILPVYIRWLCLHRDNPSSATEHWLNTAQQWVHSLRARGCRPTELDHALESHRQEYLSDMKNPWGAYARRPLPSPAEILRWFENPTVEGYRTTSRDQPDFRKTPPGDYVCNRCGKKGPLTLSPSVVAQTIEACLSALTNSIAGHHLQVCPTNLDPAYDKPPHNSYTCAICYLKGKHYRSLCPRNQDPFSLTQQRKEHAMRSETDSGAYERQLGGYGRNQIHFGGQIDFDTAQSRDKKVRSPEWAMRFDHEPGFVQTPHEYGGDRIFGTGSIKTTMDRDICESMDKKRGRQLTGTPSRSSNEGSPTPDRKQSLRKRIRRIEDYEGKLVGGKALASTQIDLIRKKAVIQKELNALNQDDSGQMDVGYEDEIPLALRLHRPSVSSDGSGQVSLDSMSVDQPKTPIGFTPIPTRSAFIQKLMLLRTKEMTEIVNVVKRRPTALTMWREDGQLRVMQAPDK
jgi:hypothetical protein